MKPTCKKRIYLTKQSGPRTKYVTPGSMLMEITEQTPLKREAEILRACLSITEAAKRLKLSWAKTRKLIAIHGYQFTDGRQFIGHNRRKIAFYDLDPNFSPSQLAELYGVSRQRVWALAKLYNVQLKGMNRSKHPRNRSE